MEAIVSVPKFIGMGVSLILSVGLPIFLLIYWKKRTGAKVTTALVGALTFVVFVFGLENALHQVCIYQDNGFSRFLNANPWAYMLYGGLAAGIFEETGRLLAFKWVLKKRNQTPTSVMYGIGHGGIEAILIGGMGAVSNLAFALSLNATGADALVASAGANSAQVAAAVETFRNTSAGMFLVSGVERVIAIGLHIALSVLVFLAAKRTGKFWLYPTAIGIHAVVDFVAVLYQLGKIQSILWVELLVLIFTACAAFWAWKLYRKDLADVAMETQELASQVDEDVPAQ